MALTLKQQKFVDAYLGVANGNGKRAAELAGYKANGHSLEQCAFQVLRSNDVKQAIQDRYRERHIDRDEVLSRIADHAKGPGEYVETIGKDKPFVNVEQLLADGKGHLIKSVKYTNKGQCIIEFHDSQAALFKIGQHLRLFEPDSNGTVNILASSKEDMAEILVLAAERRAQRLQAAQADTVEAEFKAIEGITIE